MSEGGASGYIPGSVWVPYSVSRPDDYRHPGQGLSWWQRLLRPKRSSLYQQCLALHITSAADQAETQS
jgi:hypothetical protein